MKSIGQSLAFFTRKRSLSLIEIEGILDLFPNPAFLIDRAEGVILVANAKSTTLTAFTRQELCEVGIRDLIPSFQESEVPLRSLDQMGEGVELARRGGEIIRVFLHTTSLSQNGEWMVVTMEPVETHKRKQVEQALRGDRLKNLIALTQVSNQSDFNQSIQTAMRVLRSLTGSSVQAIYYADTHSPELNRIAYEGPPEGLPHRLLPVDVAELREPTIWKKGKRLNSQLHREAIANNFAYMITTPLGTPRAMSGLLVIADREPVPFDEAADLTSIVANTLSTAIENHIHLDYLKNLLKEKSQKLETAATIQDTTEEGVLVVSRDLTVIGCNFSAELILGYANNEVIDKPIESILIGVTNLIPVLRKALDGIATHELGKVTIHRRNGQPFPCRIHTHPIGDQDRVNGIVIFLNDLSEHEDLRLRSQKLEHNALLGELSAVFAHEVRNPINNISTGLQLMESNLPPGDPNREAISRILQDTDRLTALTKSVLSYSRTIHYTMQKIKLDKLLGRIIDRWRPRFSTVNIQPRMKVVEHTPPITGNNRALDQVFTNLISNATDAMSKSGGVLAVSIQPCHGNKEMVEVCVSDTGPGIPEEYRDKIFNPFFTTDHKKGTGLGLAIAKRIITTHRGSIQLESYPVGTVFRVLLPAYKNTDSLKLASI